MHAHRPGTRIALAAAFAVCSLCVSGLSIAASMIDSMPSFDVVRSRLSLTPEQARQISPIIERRRSELRLSRQKLENASSDAEWQALLRDAQAEGDAFSAEVEKLLSTSQVSEWRELRKDTREKIKERYEEKRDAG